MVGNEGRSAVTVLAQDRIKSTKHQGDYGLAVLQGYLQPYLETWNLFFTVEDHSQDSSDSCKQTSEKQMSTQVSSCLHREADVRTHKQPKECQGSVLVVARSKGSNQEPAAAGPGQLLGAPLQLS